MIGESLSANTAFGPAVSKEIFLIKWSIGLVIPEVIQLQALGRDTSLFMWPDIILPARFFRGSAYVAFGCTHPAGTTLSMMISRWHDHTALMASGVPMPAPRASPAGPNQWFCGAPVVRALRPA